jgi:hypothetical protein
MLLRPPPRFELVCVSPALTAMAYPHAAALIERAYAASDEFVPDDLPQQFADGLTLLWLEVEDQRAIRAAMTSTLLRRPSGLQCKLVACGGEMMPLWVTHIAQIEDYARGEGCVKVYVDGRRGWERVLSPHGYRLESATISKSLR